MTGYRCSQEPHPGLEFYGPAGGCAECGHNPALAALLAEHRYEEFHAGNGFTEPRESWVACSCGVTLFTWQQYYDEHDERRPEVEYAQHIAHLFAARELRTAADGAEINTASRLRYRADLLYPGELSDGPGTLSPGASANAPGD